MGIFSGDINSNTMEKIYTIATGGGAIFIIGLLLFIIYPFDYIGHDLNELLTNNQAYFWMIGFAYATIISITTIINGVGLRENAACNK